MFKTKNIFKANNMDKRIIYALTFCLPLISMLIVYAAIGVFPFGDKTLLVMDMDGQYSEFFGYLHRVLLGGDSLQYSFTKSFGGNTVGLFSYYLSSPFSFLAVFFPHSAIPEEILVITLLKIATSGLTFAIFLRYVFKKCDMSVVLFSCCYALSMYSVHYSMCVMWLDSVIWLPIILLGLEKILEGKASLTFIVAYTLSIISNYYTCYMSTIFVGIYFFFRYVSRGGEKSIKDLGIKLLKVVGSGVLGVLLSMFILLPSFMDMLSGKLQYEGYSENGFWSLGIFDIPRRLFIGQYDTITNPGSPNIFCGIICGMMTGVFFFNPKIKLRIKIAAIVVYFVLIASFFIRVLDVVWHLFKYPNWFPCRYAYVFCFFSVMIGFWGFTKIEKRVKLWVIAGIAAHAVLILCVWLFDKECLKNAKFAVMSLIFAAGYAAIITAYLFVPKRLRPYLCCIMIIAVCTELCVNGVDTLKGLDNTFHYTLRDEYRERNNIISGFNNSIKETDSGFYRTEKNLFGTINSSMCFGYNGITHYSSTFNNNILKFNKSMGMLQEGIITRYVGSTEITDCLLGVRYIVSQKKVNDKYQNFKQTDKYTIFKNPYAQSIGFAADESALNAISYSGSVMSNQDAFARSLLGQSFVSSVPNVAQTDGGAGREFTANRDGTYYFYTDVKYSGSITLKVNGADKPFEYDSGQKKLFCLGVFKTGDKVAFKLSNANYMKNVQVASVDSDKLFAACSEKVKTDSYNITDYGSRWLKGEVTLEDGEVLFTTLPYEKGWRAYVDGKRTDVVCAQDAFLAVRVGEGTHTVKLKFTAPGLWMGSFISIITLIALLAYIYRERIIVFIREK